jgi:ankyrin repeat protein
MDQFDLTGDNELHFSARKHQKIAAQHVFSTAEFNATNYEGETPLITAVRERAVSTLRNLVLSEIDINAQDYKGNTALHYAVKEGEITVITILTKAGANSLIFNNNSESSLHLAAAKSEPKIIQLLINSFQLTRCNIDLQDKQSNTPLHIAIKNENIRTCNVLLQESASRLKINSEGNTPLHCAVQAENPLLTRSLIHAIALEHRNNNGDTPIMIATKTGNGLIFQTLLVSNSLLSIKDRNGNSLLHLACIPESSFILNFLLRRKICSIENENLESITPLHFACTKNNITAVRNLLSHGAKINTFDQLGQTPLMTAINNRNTELCMLLLTHPINNATLSMNSQDFAGNTALHWCALTDNVEIAKFLFQAGADPTIPNRHNLTPSTIFERKISNENQVEEEEEEEIEVTPLCIEIVKDEQLETDHSPQENSPSETEIE